MRDSHPTIKREGDTARTIMYMAIAHGMPLVVDRGLLIRWHLVDLPDDAERARNDANGGIRSWMILHWRGWWGLDREVQPISFGAARNEVLMIAESPPAQRPKT